MSLGLTVVTHTCSAWRRDISRCLASVKAALPKQARHIIISLDDDPDGFIEARYKAMALDEVVVFVDDDDHISPESLTLCLQALADSGAGVAFTNEVKVFPDGGEIRHHRAGCTYEMAVQTQGIIHHLTAIRTAAVSERSLALARHYGVDIEWIMKTEAALSQGAVHVPIFGYHWLQHKGQHHQAAAITARHRQSRELIIEAMHTWLGDHQGEIPVYTQAGLDTR